MIGNKYLQTLYEYEDEDTSLNQLLEFLKCKDNSFIDSLYKPINLKECNNREIKYLTIIAALIDYFLQIYCIEVPNWLRDEKLMFDRPYFYPRKRISDFEKVKLLYTNPAPFRNRNVYFDLNGIQRI